MRATDTVMRRAGAALLTWVVVTCTAMGASSLVVAGPWLAQLALLTALVTVVTWVIVSSLGRSHPGWAGLCAEVVSLAIWVGQLCGVAGGGSGVTRFLPTPSALDHVVASVAQAVAALSDYGRPAGNVELFMPLVLVGLGPVCVLTVCLALVARRPVWAGLPMGVCWGLFLVGGPTKSLGWALAAATAYLLLVALADKPRRWFGQMRPASVAVVLVAAIGAVGMTAVAPRLPGWGWAQTWAGQWGKAYVDATGISIDGAVDIGQALRQQSTEVLFRTQGDLTSPLKLGSMSFFDGVNWSAAHDGSDGAYDLGATVGGLDPQMSFGADGSPTWRSDVPAQWSSAAPITVTINRLTGSSLPVTVGPRSVSASRRDARALGLEYEVLSDALHVTGGLSPGQVYTIDPTTLDRTSLAGRAVTADLQPDQWRGGSFGHAQEITDLTRSILDGASDQDGILRAIESYLTGPQFFYTTTPTWDAGGDPVWAFLNDKHGYCVHFASAMAEMASSVGVPMRVSIGYLPGTMRDDGSRDVTGLQAHMWPEAFFDGIGWVAYEPTPGTSDGVAGGGETESATPTPTSTPTPTTTPGAAPSLTAAPSASSTTAPQAQNRSGWSSAWPWLAGVGGLLLVAGLVALGVTSHIRRYRAQDAWDAIWQVALERGVVQPGMSLRVATAAINRRLGLQSVLAQELTDVCDRLELSRYGPPGGAVGSGHGGEVPGPGGGRLAGAPMWRLKNAVVAVLRAKRAAG